MMLIGLWMFLLLIAFGLEWEAQKRYDLMLHGVASLLLAWSLLQLLPPPYRRPHWLGLVPLFSLVFFIPILGGIGLATAALLALYWPRRSRSSPFMEHAIPALPDRPVLADPRTRLRQRGLVGILTCADGVEARVRAVTAASRLPDKEAIPILQRALKDPADEVRLLAYVMLDRKERTINARIQHHRAQLNHVKTEHGTRWRQRLAQDYWELCYLGLARGDVRRHCLTTAHQYMEEALSEHDKNPGLRLFQARILLNLGECAAAREALVRARADGLPEINALPYLAELAFHQRDFSAVRAALHALAPHAHRRPGLERLVRFWLAAEP